MNKNKPRSFPILHHVFILSMLYHANGQTLARKGVRFVMSYQEDIKYYYYNKIVLFVLVIVLSCTRRQAQQ